MVLRFDRVRPNAHCAESMQKTNENVGPFDLSFVLPSGHDLFSMISFLEKGVILIINQNYRLTTLIAVWWKFLVHHHKFFSGITALVSHW